MKRGNLAVQKTDSKEIPLIRPKDLFKNLKVKPQALVVFDPFDWNLIISQVSIVSGSFKNLQFSSLQSIRVNDKIITLAGPAMGAPVAAMVLEILIAFGASQIIGLGSCGSLNKKIRVGHLVIPEGAFSEEGTSSHYPLKGRTIKPSPRIFHGLKLSCQNQGQIWASGKVWTTDAPFREIPQKIKRFQQKQALAVEMELSAFLKVGNFYGVEVGALLVISDELFASQWNSGYNKKIYKETFLKAVEIIFNLFSRLPPPKVLA